MSSTVVVGLSLLMAAWSQQPGAQATPLVDAVPQDTFALLRVRGLRIQVATLVRTARALFDARGPLSVVADDDWVDKGRALLRLAGNVERILPVRSVEAALAAEVVVGAAMAPGEAKPRGFVLARFHDSATASRAARPFLRTFHLPLQVDGCCVWMAQGPRTAQALRQGLGRLRNGERSSLGQRFAHAVDLARPIAAWLDLEHPSVGPALRAGLAKPLDDGGVAFLVGGLGRALARATSLAAVASFAGDQLSVSLRAPGALAHPSAAVRAALGLDGPPPPDPPPIAATIARVRLSRSIAGFAQHRRALAGPRARQQWDQFLSNVEMFFKGRTVERDVFPDLGPGFALVATRGPPPNGEFPHRMPTGAVVTRLSGRRLPRALDAAMQVLMLIVNQDRGRRGKIPFRARAGRGSASAGVRWFAATLRRPSGGRPWPLEAALAPSLARTKSAVAFGFSKDLCRKLAGRPDAAPRPASVGRVLDAIELCFDQAAAAVRDARDVLRARVMLNRGLDPRRAAAYVDALAELVGMLGHASFETTLRNGDLTASLVWRPRFASLGAVAPVEVRR